MPNVVNVGPLSSQSTSYAGGFPSMPSKKGSKGGGYTRSDPDYFKKPAREDTSASPEANQRRGTGPTGMGTVTLRGALGEMYQLPGDNPLVQQMQQLGDRADLRTLVTMTLNPNLMWYSPSLMGGDKAGTSSTMDAYRRVAQNAAANGVTLPPLLPNNQALLANTPGEMIQGALGGIAQQAGLSPEQFLTDVVGGYDPYMGVKGWIDNTWSPYVGQVDPWTFANNTIGYLRSLGQNYSKSSTTGAGDLASSLAGDTSTSGGITDLLDQIQAAGMQRYTLLPGESAAGSY